MTNRRALTDAMAVTAGLGTTAISVDCTACGSLAGARCQGGAFCTTRVQRAGAITREANRVAKDRSR